MHIVECTERCTFLIHHINTFNIPFFDNNNKYIFNIFLIFPNYMGRLVDSADCRTSKRIASYKISKKY